jgi:hypothetical protein
MAIEVAPPITSTTTRRSPAHLEAVFEEGDLDLIAAA